MCDIPLATQEDDLHHCFSQHGRVDTIRVVPRDSFVIAFVSMSSVQEADACIRNLNNTSLFQGEKPMKVRTGFQHTLTYLDIPLHPCDMP